MKRRRSQDARDAIELGAYSIPDAAHYLRLPTSTVRSWVAGRPYPTRRGRQRFEPLIDLPDTGQGLLSFRNLVELHVLSAIRRKHQVRLHEIRKALEFLRTHFGVQHPLADQQVTTDGRDLFVERYGTLINASQAGQIALKEVLEDYLQRIERDDHGIVARLYPFSGRAEARAIALDPRVKFGRPCLAGTGIATNVIVERFDAGDTISQIAKDYRRPPSDIEEAIRFEKAAA